jgi:two-component system LytT family response regulator
MTMPASAPGPAAPMRALIVDDEALARQRVRRLLGAAPDVEIVGECASGEEALEAIRAQRPDVVFLDVQMPALDGFGVVSRLDPGTAPMVVFVTAFDQHAVRAFEASALDYLLKPVDPARLRAALDRVRARRELDTAAERWARLVAAVGAAPEAPAPAPAALSRATPRPSRWLERVLVREQERMFFVRAADIDWIEAYGNYARLHVGPRVHLVRCTMRALEGELDPTRFARIHRSTIVNLDRVCEMQPWFSGDYAVILSDGTRLRLSRWYRDRVEGLGEAGRRADAAD